MSAYSDTPRAAVADGVAKTSAAGAAANGVLAGILDETARDPNVATDVRKAAVDHLSGMGQLPAAVAAQAPQPVNGPLGTVSAFVEEIVASPQPQVEAEVPVEVPQFGAPEIPEDVEAWLDEPDDLVEPDDEPVLVSEETDEDEYVDDAVLKERKRRLAAERQAEHYKQLRVRESRGKWEGEVRKARLALSDEQVSAISADSRRGFWREAKRLHDQNMQVVASLGIDPAAIAERANEQATSQARQQAVAAWGTPMVTGPAPTPAGTLQQQAYVERVHRARQGKSFQNLVRTMMRGPEE